MGRISNRYTPNTMDWIARIWVLNPNNGQQRFSLLQQHDPYEYEMQTIVGQADLIDNAKLLRLLKYSIETAVEEKGE